MHSQVTAEITNDLDERFEYAWLRFLMPHEGADIQVTGGNLVQVDSSDSPDVYYVAVDMLPSSSQTVTVSLLPPPVTDLHISLSENDLALTWSPPGGQAIAHYVIYRNTGPYFVPTSGDSIGSTWDTIYIDSGMAGAPGLNHYYAVKAVSESGEKSDPSNTVGEYDINLHY